MAIAFGNNRARLERSAEMAALGFFFPALVDPTAVVADGISIGPGTYIAAGAIVQPGAELGSQVIVNTGAIVDHDCHVEDGAHICPRACLAGHARMGVPGSARLSGAGSGTRWSRRVRRHRIVGAQDVSSRVVAYGHPAREIGKVEP